MGDPRGQRVGSAHTNLLRAPGHIVAEWVQLPGRACVAQSQKSSARTGFGGKLLTGGLVHGRVARTWRGGPKMPFSAEIF